MRDLDSTNYPGWPECFYTHKPEIPTGPGLMGTNSHFPDVRGGPDPEQVTAWKASNNATITQTCEHFGLSRLQVVKVVGES